MLTPVPEQERDASPPPRSAAKAVTKKAAASKAAGVPDQPMDHNNESCELCQSGGDLICCEKCPAVYHCECLGKTIEELPDHYICPRCDGSFDKVEKNFQDHLNTKSLILSKDFCDFCGDETLNNSTLPSIGCSACHRSFHRTCADVPLKEPSETWRCPSCLGTTAEVFTWARLVAPLPPKEIGEPLFKENNAPARRPDEEAGREEPERPAGKGKGAAGGKGAGDKDKGSPAPKKSENGTPAPKGRGRPPSVVKAAAKTPKTPKTPADSSCDSPSDAAMPKKRGRPPKVKPSPAEAVATPDGGDRGDGGDGGDEEPEEDVIRSGTRERRQRRLED